MGKGGFAYDAEAVRGFAAVFAEAKTQVEQVKSTLSQTSAKGPDFGKAWASDAGSKFEQYIQMLAEDLTNLATHLGEINANLNKGTDLVVNADTSGYQSMKDIHNQLPGGQTSGSHGGTKAV